MNSKILINGVEPRLSNKFKIQVIERRPGHPDEGKVVSETPLIPNLILTQGMDLIQSTLICNLFYYCAIGSGTTPTEDDSGVVTATTSGTDCTASTGFFAVGDIGKLLRFDTGEKAVITGYTSGTLVALDSTLGVSGATEFTMYRVNQVGLTTEVKRTANFFQGTGNCGTTRATNVFTHQRTFDFTIEVGDVSYSEVGFSGSASAGANLNTRGIFTTAPVSVLTGQQLRVVYYFVVSVSPHTPRDREVTISGWPALENNVVADDSTDRFSKTAHGLLAEDAIFFDGVTPPSGISFNTTYYARDILADSFKVEASIGGGAIDFTTAGTGVIMFTSTVGQEQLVSCQMSSVSTDGSTSVTGAAGTANIDEPSTTKYMKISTSVTTLPSFFSNPSLAESLTASVGILTKASYVAGNFYTVWSRTYAAGDAVSSIIRALFVCDNSFSSTSQAAPRGLTYVFDHPQEKSSLFTLQVSWKFSWDRDFV